MDRCLSTIMKVCNVEANDRYHGRQQLLKVINKQKRSDVNHLRHQS